MVDRIPQDVLEKYLWDSAKLLRTNIDAGSYKQYIFPLLFFKRLCDVFDEKKAADEAKYGADAALYADDYLFKIPQGAHWRDVRDVSEDVGEALVKAFKAIENENPEQLTGIFGDAAWTNKKRLPDRLLKSLMEHFSSQTLSLARCPEDELGKGYEYLIKQFADDSGHTAQEFYTNRTVVALMTEMLQPKPKESIYDPTCGSGGMLISAIKWLKDRGEEYRNVRIYGQEINAITSAIARMNLFLHGIADFHIVNADTLKYPAFVKGGKLQTFDMVLANPPYSISQWDRTAFEDDKWGRNFLGTPPQGRADYAFFQHILKSLDSKTGRCAILLPHGILFRNEERDIREKLVKSDLVEAVIGLAPNLFFNSPMESCILICRTDKPKNHRGKILFVNAVKDVERKNTQSYLTGDHIKKIAAAYKKFSDQPEFAHVAPADEIAANDFSLNIPLYVRSTILAPTPHDQDLSTALPAWYTHSQSTAAEFAALGRARSPSAPQTQHKAISFRGGFVQSKIANRYRFDDIAMNSVAKKKPQPEDAATYVGLEHLDPECFEVTRWGGDVAPIGEKLLMRKGDVLFGKRRAYQRKVAIAPFDGIFSAHGMVLRPKEDVIDRSFFPFLIASDAFIAEAIRISVGGLSPTINWKDLKQLEFSLPPLAEQKKLAETLWAMERVKRAYKKLLSETDRVVEARFVEMFGDPVKNDKGWPIDSLDRIGTNLDSRRVPITSGDRKPGPYPYYGASGIVDHVADYIFDEKILLISEDGANLLARTTPIAFTVIGKSWVNNHAHVMRFSDDGTHGYIGYLINMLDISQYVTGTAQPKLNQAKLNSIPIPLPPLPLQCEFAAFVEQAEKAKASLKESLAALTAAQKALMNQAFGKGIAG